MTGTLVFLVLFLIVMTVAFWYVLRPIISEIQNEDSLLAWVRLITSQRRGVRYISEETALMEEELYAEVIEVQKLAILKLADADDELKTRIARLLIDATIHLGEPTVAGSRLYEKDHLRIERGHSLLGQVKQLIESYKPDNA